MTKNNTLGVWLGIALAMIVLAFLASLAVTPTASAASCHTTGRAPFTAPDNRCTPGRFVRLTPAQVCTSKDRPDLSTSERRKLLAAYGVPGWTHVNGEIDHRVPVFLGGLTVRTNLWPQAGPDPLRAQNPKDRLEVLVRARVCGGSVGYHPDRATMRVKTAVRLFEADWRPAYTYYVLGIGPRPAVWRTAANTSRAMCCATSAASVQLSNRVRAMNASSRLLGRGSNSHSRSRFATRPHHVTA